MLCRVNNLIATERCLCFETEWLRCTIIDCRKGADELSFIKAAPYVLNSLSGEGQVFHVLQYQLTKILKAFNSQTTLCFGLSHGTKTGKSQTSPRTSWSRMHVCHFVAETLWQTCSGRDRDLTLV